MSINTGTILILVLTFSAFSVLANSSSNTTTTTTPSDLKDTINRQARDSYLDAYKSSQHPSTDTATVGGNSHQQQSDYYGAPISKPSPVYTNSKYGTPPSTQYGSPPNVMTEYGAPSTEYGAPSTEYGPSKHNSYPVYGIPHFHHHYNINEPEPDPIEDNQGHGGFELKTVFKFLAKVLFIKKIAVKVVFLIFLFLFLHKVHLPSLMLGDIWGGSGSSDGPEEDDAASEDAQEDEIMDDDDDFRSGRKIPISKINTIDKKVKTAINEPKW